MSRGSENPLVNYPANVLRYYQIQSVYTLRIHENEHPYSINIQVHQYSAFSVPRNVFLSCYGAQRLHEQSHYRRIGSAGDINPEFLTEKLPAKDNFTYDLIDPLVDRLGKANNARVTFIDLDGVVWGDTERDGQALRAMDNHLTRPEVQDVIKKGIGIRDRYSNTTQTEFRYFALPIYRNVGAETSPNGEGTLIGICRVALPMETVNTVIDDLRRMALIASVAGLILTIVFSVFSTGAITKPIQKLTQMTQSLAAGNINSRVPVDSRNELGQLSQNFNLMADRIQEQIDEISEEHRRSATILTNMGEGVLLVNGASEITYANPTAISMLALPDAYMGKALIEINRIPELQALLKKAEETETIAFAEIQLGNLREPEAEVTVVPVSAGQEYVIVIHDVTKERQLERIRADFVANVSHELRTPWQQFEVTPKLYLVRIRFGQRRVNSLS